MKVLIDTPIWSLALRRQPDRLAAAERRLVSAWAKLIRDRKVMLIGPIRQEILSGVRDETVFDRLREHLRAFEDPSLEADDYEQAARYSNACRAKGVAGSAVDFLLCAVAVRRGAAIFTTDADFTYYARHLPIRLHRPPA